jgi:hypothetical protein
MQEDIKTLLGMLDCSTCTTFNVSVEINLSGIKLILFASELAQKNATSAE